MKQFNSLKTFHKVVRKYWKRHARKTYFKWHGRSIANYWTDVVWCCYIITNPSELDSNIAQRYISFDVDSEQFDTIIPEWKEHIGKTVQISFKDNEPIEGVFYIALQNNGASIALKQSDGIYFYPFCYKIK